MRSDVSDCIFRFKELLMRLSDLRILQMVKGTLCLTENQTVKKEHYPERKQSRDC